MAKVIKVAIVEDARDIRESLEALIAGTPGFACAGAYDSAESAIEGIPGQIPEVVLMDINLPGINGVNAVKLLKEIFPAVHFLMCTVFKDDENIFQSLRAGAGGYILKSGPTSKILEAIQEVMDGGAPMSPTIARQVIDSFHNIQKESKGRHAELTSREMEVLQLLSRGLLCKEVADKLDLSLQTIRNHCAKIYEKLHVNTRLEAINIIFGNKY
jgi:DNA-binding NarL/FixJ family response regulator